MINTLFSDMIGKEVYTYLDDLIICSKDGDSHLARLKAVLDLLVFPFLSCWPFFFLLVCHFSLFLFHFYSNFSFFIKFPLLSILPCCLLFLSFPVFLLLFLLFCFVSFFFFFVFAITDYFDEK